MTFPSETPSRPSQKHVTASRLTRRAFMAAAGTVVSIGLPVRVRTLRPAEARDLAGALRPDGRPRLPPGQMAVKKLRDMGGTRPADTAEPWALTVSGQVGQPQSLTPSALSELPRCTVGCDVHCVTGWTLLDAVWQGVRLRDFMAAAGVLPAAAFVVFTAPGGYSSSIPMAEARKDNVLLADSFDGRPLAPAHGAPWRVVVPDRYFYKSVKWVQTIEFSVEDQLGSWESSGFSNSADPWKEERYELKETSDEPPVRRR